MVSIIIKFQKCGKKTCKCYKEGKLHGPYFWAVTYKGSHQGRAKYKWTYLGKAIEKTIEKLGVIFPEVDVKSTQEKLQSKLTKLLERSGDIKEGEYQTIHLKSFFSSLISSNTMIFPPPIFPIQ